MDRRKFLKTAGVAASASFVLPRFSIAQTKSPSSTLNIALIGVGGIGGMSIGGCQSQNIVGACDIDLDYASKGLAKIKKTSPKAQVFTDYRKMLDKLGKDIDAVCISTPDHSHFKITMDCMSAGKHVATQKPLTYTIWQARELKKAKAYYSKLKTQMMNQGHASEQMRYIREWYESGFLGDVKEVHAWYRGPNWSTKYFSKPDKLPIAKENPPAGLDWDLWLADLKPIPYSHYFHPLSWRSFWDCGTGMLGDWFCHTGDAPVYSLDLKDATAVECLQRDVNFNGDVVIPNSSKIKWEFPANKKRPAVTFYWYDGGMKPEIPNRPDLTNPGNGGMWMIGSKQVLETGPRPNFGLKIKNTEAFAELKKNMPAKKYPRTPKGSLYQEWFEDIKGTGPECGSNFDYASQLSEVALLGVLAQRFGGRIEFDSKNMKITNRPELNAHLKYPQRKGWETKALA